MDLDLWDEMRAMERRFDNLFRAFLGPRAQTIFPALPVGLRQPFLPATDVYATEGDLAVRLELPGVDPAKDGTVTIEEGDLVVRGERKRKEEVKDEDQERQDGQGRLRDQGYAFVTAGKLAVASPGREGGQDDRQSRRPDRCGVRTG